MNYKVIAYYLGQILKIVSLFLFLPVAVGLYYGERIWPFFISIAIGLALGVGLTYPMQLKSKNLHNKEALVIVGLAWVVTSLIGALPFTIDGCIPNYIDALFETISGFTTTGATILDEIEKMPNCMLFWRSFTHWLGGMGILVFILAIMPGTDGSTFHLFKFESPGPQVGKIASKVRHTATILYLIYLVMTLLQALLLLFDPNVDLFNAVTIAMSTAGTGGFANYGQSIAAYDSLYVEIVVTVFMFLFSLNFNLYYLLILRHYKIAFADEEFHFYLGYVFLSIAVIVINLVSCGMYTFGEALRYSSFTVISLSSSTGFVNSEFADWPQLSKNVLIVCMIFGSSAGSTGGGLKASRVLILLKAAYAYVLSVLRPRSVQVVRLNKKPLAEEEVTGIIKYLLLYALIFLIAMLLLSGEKLTFMESFTAVVSGLSNDGPYFAGAFAGYGGFTYLGKIVMMLLMLIGRLEIFPVLLLFVPKTWKRSY